VNVVISEGFRSDLKALSKEDRRHAWDAIDKLIESPSPHAGGLQTKKMKSTDVYEIRASLSLRILARRDGDDICCVRVGPHDRTLKAGAEGRLGVMPDVQRLRTFAADSDLALTMDAGNSGGSAAVKAGNAPSGPLAAFDDDTLRGRFSIPDDWIATVRSMRTEEQFVSQDLETIISEAAWYELAALFPPTPIVSTGAAPTYRVPSLDVARAFATGKVEELEFNLPASSWGIVERTRRGPIFVRGGPGTGKSLLGLYRALHALDRPATLDRGAPRVLYATFTRTLAEDARCRVELLRGSVPPELEISTVDRLVEQHAPNNHRTTYEERVIAEVLHAAIVALPELGRFDDGFIRSEIENVIVARGLRTLDAYLTVSRTGRRQRLAQGDRRAVWSAYEGWTAGLAARGFRTLGEARIAALEAVQHLDEAHRYDLVVVDEVQDLTTTALGLTIGLARGEATFRDVTLVGDGGQSIYRAGFKWADVGLRLGGGRVVTLETCERSSVEILRFAAALAGRHQDEHDEDRLVTASRVGPRPRIVRNFPDREDQRAWLVGDLRERLRAVDARRIAVISRTKTELERVREALTAAHIACVDYGAADFHRRDAVRCITAHSAKGLEFGDVYVVGVDDGSFPLVYTGLSEDDRTEKIGSDARLLYVAATRARERLTLLCGTRPSPFLEPALSCADEVAG